jgi:hypothetical protein
MKFLSNLNLNGNQLLNVRAQVLGAAPGSTTEGLFYYDSTDQTLKVRNNTSWVPLIKTVNTNNASQLTATFNSDGTLTLNILSSETPAGGKLVAYDSFGDIYASKFNGDLVGNANTASKLLTARTISLSGKVNGSVSFDGSANVTINTTVSLAAADIPTLTASKISDFTTAVQAVPVNQLALPTGALDLNNQKITNLAVPTQDSDAANKAYVDATRSGLDFKASVKVASTSNIPLNDDAPSSLDGVSIGYGDRVLIKDQMSPEQNGIYEIINVADVPRWQRAADADSDAEVTPGMFVFVEQGNTYADTGWVLSTDGPITLGTTPLTFVQFSGAGQISAGAGLSKSGNTLSVNAYTGTATNRGQTVIENDAVAVILGTGANQAAKGNHTHTLADISDTIFSSNATFGGNEVLYFDGLYWDAKTLDQIYTNGAASTIFTNNLTANRVLVSNGSGKVAASTITDTELGYLSGVTANVQSQLDLRTRKYKQAIGDGSTTSFTITHNLNTVDVVTSVRETTGGNMVYTDVRVVDANNISVTFATAPASGEFTVVVIG